MSLPELSALLGAIPSLSGLISSFTQSQRLLRVQFSPDADIAADALLPHQLTGSEGICEDLDYRLQCLSTSATIPLKALEGLSVACNVMDGEGSDHAICGIVTEVAQLGANGGFALYELRIQDALSILRLRTTWRVFLRKSILDITQQILDEHLADNPVLASAFAYDLSNVQGDYPSREFTMQAGESDFAFLTRIWRREGLCWYFSHSSDGDWPLHTLNLSDSSDGWQDNSAGTVRFHRADATEDDDTITAFQARRKLIASSLRAISPDYQSANLGSTEQLTALKQGDKGTALASTLTQYRFDSPHLADNQTHYAQMSRRWIQAQEQQAKWFSGAGVVRAFTGGVGTVFSLDGHAEIDQHPEEERRFVLTHLQLTVRNNLLNDTAANSQLHLDSDTPPFAVSFDCVRSSIPIAPTYDPACVPVVGPMSAIVVGSGDAEVDVDEQYRIAINLVFPSSEEHPDAGASYSADDSARVRIVQPFADAGYGMAFVPRVNSEVLIQFVANDPDRPVCVGNLRPFDKSPNRFDGLGSMPGNAALYGIRSKEIKGGAAGELLFDDTTGQIKTKLSSDYGNTAINQGWIGGPRRDGVSEKRGEGLEMRTDLSAVLRAAKGVLLTAESQPSAAGKVLDRQQLIGLLDVIVSITKKLSDISDTHSAEKTDTEPSELLLAHIKQWEEDKAGAPVVAVSAPLGVVLGSHATVSASAGRHVDITAVQDINLSTGRKILMRAAQGISQFAHKLGMKLIAASGPISIQAQAGTLEAGAAKRLHLWSLEEIVLEAPRITHKTGGVTHTMTGGKITMSAQSAVEIQSGDFKFSAGGDGSVDLPDMPSSKLKTDEQVAFASRSGAAHENLPYEISDESGATRDGGNSAMDGSSSIKVKDSVIRPLDVKPK